MVRLADSHCLSRNLSPKLAISYPVVVGFFVRMGKACIRTAVKTDLKPMGEHTGIVQGLYRKLNENGLSLAWPIRGNGLDTYCVQILNMDMSQIYCYFL